MNNIQQLVTQTKAANPSATAQELFSLINNSRTIPNPVARGQVLPTLDITVKAELIIPAQRVVIENQLSGTWNSLLSNFANGKLQDVFNNVENLVASGLLSQPTIDILMQTMAEASTPIPDPNWQSTVTQPLWADFNLRPVYIGECA